MKNLIIILSLLVTFSACNMKQYCHDRYPPETITETEYEKQIVYRDTLIYINVKPDTVFQKDTVFVKKGVLQSNRLVADTEYCEGWAQVVNGNLLHELSQKESKIEELLQIKEKTTTKTEYKQVKVEVPADLSWWQQTMIRAGYALLVLIMLVITGIFLRKKIPFL